MENQTLLSACLALTAAAVALQAGILVALYLAVRKSSARMEALATEVKTKLLPTAETVHSMLTDLRPKIETLLTNASETSGIVRGQLERLDATVNDVLDRARLQVIRADEFLNRTMDRVEEATEAVHKTVVSIASAGRSSHGTASSGPSHTALCCGARGHASTLAHG